MSSSYLFANGLRIRYLYENIEGEESPIILLHGLASNARIWELILPSLANAGHPCYAPDLRGHGLTDKPDNGYDFEAYFHDLEKFIDTLEIERPLIVGHAWGANLALDYAAQRSIGLHAPLGIVLIEGGVIQLDQVPGATWENTRQRLEPPPLAGTPLEEFLASFRQPTFKWQPGGSMPPARNAVGMTPTVQPGEREIQIILANFEISEDDRIYPRLSFEHHMQIVQAMWEFKTLQRYPLLRCAVLAILAQPAPPLRDDEASFLKMKQRSVARLLESQSDLRARWIKDAIHDIPLQRPLALSQEILNFIGEIERKPG